MRKQLFTNPYLLLFGLLVIIVALLFHRYLDNAQTETVAINCPQHIEVADGSALLWESLSNQFVHSASFK
ncbi:MAG TPA: hypothetical protein VM888_14695 [Chitinophagaceae bacterium]|nr:hypothetical protein [Chitinophagaceae bacterium]